MISPFSLRPLVFTATIVSIAVLSGCGILIPDANQPEVAYRFRDDPERITQWTLEQTHSRDVGQGVEALLYICGRSELKCAAAASGYLRIYQKLVDGWPGITESQAEDRRWWMRRILTDPIGHPSGSFAEVAARLGPPGPRPEGYGTER